MRIGCNALISISRRFWVLCFILSVSMVSSAQMAQILRSSVPPRGSEAYWSAIDEFADVSIQLAYAKRFVQLHDGSMNDRQCEEYSRLAERYESRVSMLKRSGISENRSFWSDLRTYSNRMIGEPGVPIPGERASTYWLTTGSEAEDKELRRLVSWQLDEAAAEVSPSGDQRSFAAPYDCRIRPRSEVTSDIY